MPFSRPTLTDLRQQAAADIASNLDGADGLLRRSNLYVTAAVQAGMANLHYGYLDWIAKMAVPFTSEGEFLEGWAGLVDITRNAAEPATGGVTLTGISGTDIPAATLVVRGDGETYSTNADATVGGGGSVTIACTAILPGAAGNADSGVTLTLASAIAGVQSNGVAASDFTGGADVEGDDSLMARMLQRYRAPPQGGAASDYETWALGVPGVTRCWVARNGQGPGTVVVYFMMDQSEAVHDGFPQGSNGVAAGETRDNPAAGDQLAVADALWPVQPVTALVYACAPNAAPQDFTIAGLSPNTAPMKAAVEAAIATVFLSEGVAVGADGYSGGTIPAAHITAGIDAVPGLDDYIITSPLADIATAVGSIPTVGTITWA